MRLDSSLVSRTLLVDLIHDQINRIYYILLAMLTDAHIETTSDYWHNQRLLEQPATTGTNSDYWNHQRLLEPSATTGTTSDYWNNQRLLELPATTGTTSDYWLQFSMTGVSVVYPTTQLVNGITVPLNDFTFSVTCVARSVCRTLSSCFILYPLNDFTIQPTDDVVTHWQDFVDEITVCFVVLL